MKKIFFFAALLHLSLFANGQNIESKIKTICYCQPVSFYPEIINNKIYFTKLIDDEFTKDLYLFSYEKIGNKWIQNFKYMLDGECDSYSLEPSENSVEIDKKEYFYSIYYIANHGTAYNGRDKYMFVFQDLNQLKDPVIIYYEKWTRDNNGDYTVKGQTNINPYKAFIKKCSEFIDKTFDYSNYDIDSPENFDVKWNIENEGIFKSIENDISDIPIRPVEFYGNTFYNNKKGNEKELKTNKYQVVAGFASPIFVYNIMKKTSQVIYIPEGWPNGGAWGLRSYYLKSLDGNILTIESDENYLKIDLTANVLNVVKK